MFAFRVNGCQRRHDDPPESTRLSKVAKGTLELKLSDHQQRLSQL
ncbi:hypothetical protein T4D_5516 [Trichinella pseudospiralis]|uniref:Uncharacterized protein n=1 Tax=Trichinella pseudospiralis TaxID=6337 RepID=A0A0V1G5J3_TRIPS|nr:hypothetical protein T4D_5516 [Trichinella pseudospiralis]